MVSNEASSTSRRKKHVVDIDIDDEDEAFDEEFGE
jgi:hypothetical protein